MQPRQQEPAKERMRFLTTLQNYILLCLASVAFVAAAAAAPVLCAIVAGAAAASSAAATDATAAQLFALIWVRPPHFHSTRDCVCVVSVLVQILRNHALVLFPF